MTFASSGLVSCSKDKTTDWQGDPSQPSVPTDAGWGPTTPVGQPSDTPAPVYHNTVFCKVDAAGAIVSEDTITADPGDDPAHGQGGGCIARPIREVWAVLLNAAVMKPDQVDAYTLEDRCPATGAPVVFCFDYHNVVHALGGLINPEWTVRWYHAVPYGTYEQPDEVTVNFQKIEGTTHIDSMKGGYVLDRVSDTVTGFAMDQSVKADQYDHTNAYNDIRDSIGTMRKGAPDWSMLPEHLPVRSGDEP